MGSKVWNLSPKQRKTLPSMRRMGSWNGGPRHLSYATAASWLLLPWNSIDTCLLFAPSSMHYAIHKDACPNRPLLQSYPLLLMMGSNSQFMWNFVRTSWCTSLQDGFNSVIHSNPTSDGKEIWRNHSSSWRCLDHLSSDQVKMVLLVDKNCGLVGTLLRNDLQTSSGSHEFVLFDSSFRYLYHNSCL